MTTPTISRTTFAKTIPVLMDRLIVGNYAAHIPGTIGQIEFFRIAVPKRGQFKDHWIVQRRESENLSEHIIVLPPHHPYVDSAKLNTPDEYVERTRIISTRLFEALIIASQSPAVAGALFAEKLEKCQRCGKSLTDEYSRFYGIGPECEKVASWFFEEQVMRKGFFDLREAE